MMPHRLRRINGLPRPRTLRAHLVLLILMTAVPLVLFAAGVILLYAQQERQTAERGMRETVRALALAVDREVDEVTTGLGVLALSGVLAARCTNYSAKRPFLSKPSCAGSWRQATRS